MKRFAYALAAFVFLADQLVKYWIMHVVELEQRITVPVLPFLSLTWVENRGVSMGMLTADTEVGRWLLVGLTALIRKEAHWPESLALGLILGGALGNIVDRVRFGYVVDFVHLHWGPWSFYVFNIADAAITAGVIILLFRALIGRSDASSERLPNA